MMKFISWNVNGLRACVKPKTDDEGNVKSKGFEAYFKELDADFFCLQETKMQEGQLDLQFEGYQSYWNYAERKGYSGTAIYTRHTPLSVNYGIGIEEHDHEGRVVTLEMTDFYLVCVYTPNSQEAETKGGKPRRLAYRMKWEDDFQAYLHALDEKKPVIVCGDMNVAHEEIDIKNPKTNHLSAGFTDEERGKMTTLLSINMLEEFQDKFGLTYLFISHDLSMVRHISDNVGVMYLGSLVEYAPVEELYQHMLHPYTKSLMSAVPAADPKENRSSKRIVLSGEVPSPLHPPKGCPFWTRCQECMEKCAEERPVLKDVGGGHLVACHKCGT